MAPGFAVWVTINPHLNGRMNWLQRAYELAASGSCLTIRDIAYKLHAEKYDISNLEGPALKKQLQTLIDAATKSKECKGAIPLEYRGTA